MMDKACVSLPQVFHLKQIVMTNKMLNDLMNLMWYNCKSNDALKYDVSNASNKALGGEHNFIVNYNEHRFFKKRAAPAKITSCNHQFEENCFNFNKLAENEVLCTIEVDKESDCTNISIDKETGDKSIVAVNNCPLSEPHVLLIPSPQSCYNQRLTVDALQLGLSFLIGSGNPDMRIAFNSLCSFASVNHLHLHAYKCENTLPVECAAVRHVASSCYALLDYPTPGFVFELQTDTVRLVKEVWVLVDLLQAQDIPHNLFITYGDPCQDSSAVLVPNPTIRVCIWPAISEKQFESENKDALFRPASCEFAGHILVHSTETYDSITETDIVNVLKSRAVDSIVFNELLISVKNRLQDI